MLDAHTQQRQPDSELFRYTPLVGEHDIRLLKLEESSSGPNTIDGRIAGKLVHRSLDDLGSNSPTCIYYAISYAWGDPTPTDQLWLSETEYLPVNASAAYILRHVTCDEFIWIDSVCINQKDNDEKSIQLRYMWGIYKFAKEVLAWPGGPEDNVDLAMELLFDISYARLTRNITGRTPVVLPRSSILFLPGSLTALWKNSRPPIPPNFHFDPERWLALAKFLDRPWWRRAWVIQEVVAAREVTFMIGTGKRNSDNMMPNWKLFNAHAIGHILKWEDLVAVINHLESWNFLYFLEMTVDVTPGDLPLYPEGVASIQRIKALKPARDNQQPGFQDNLLTTMAADATDARDKVFAIGSMSYGSLTKELWPDYKLSVEDVYINATRYLLVRDQYLMTLHMAGIGWHRRLKDLPSWVPDYSVTRRTGTRHGQDFVLGKIASSALFASASFFLVGWKACVEPLGSWRQLIRIRGVIIDDIRFVCKGLSPNRSIQRSMDSENWIDRKVIRSWLTMVRSEICPGTYSKPYLRRSAVKPLAQGFIGAPLLECQALASALIVGTSYNGQPMGVLSLHAPLDMMYGMFEECVDEGIRPSTISEPEEIANELDAYLNALDRLPNWTVFRTATGYIGRGPPRTKIGDKVCVFEGARTPFIIRKAAIPWYAPATFYHLVGECYVEGLMAREATCLSPWKWGFITLW